MKQPSYESKISFGNILQMGALVISIGMGWGVLQSNNRANEIAITEFKAELIVLETRLRKIETQDARNQERFNSLLTLLERIDGRLARLEN